jgi:hypothetical protein
MALAAGEGLMADRRVAVVFFEDKSGFDAPAGCGCLPLGPLASLFGKARRHRERWNLESGFRDMLVGTLSDARGYVAIPPPEVMSAFAELGVERRDFKREDVRMRLADALDAHALVTARIRKFKQERIRGIIQRRIVDQGVSPSDLVQGRRAQGGARGLSASVGAAGSYYRATVEADLTVYGLGGKEVVVSRVEASDAYEGGTVVSGPIEATVSGEGATAYIGGQRILGPSKPSPVVRHEVLDRVKFGTPGWDAPAPEGAIPNYRDTLLGRVTQQLMDRIVEKLRDRIGPTLDELGPEEPAQQVAGKVVFFHEETGDLYIDLGTAARLSPGQRLRVYKVGLEVKDPDTGEVLGSLEEAAGVVEVVEVLRPRLSKVRVVSGEAAVRDVVRTLAPKTEARGAETEETTKP